MIIEHHTGGVQAAVYQQLWRICNANSL